MSTTVLLGLTSFQKIGGQWIFGGASDFSNLLGQWLQELNVEGCGVSVYLTWIAESWSMFASGAQPVLITKDVTRMPQSAS